MRAFNEIVPVKLTVLVNKCYGDEPCEDIKVTKTTWVDKKVMKSMDVILPKGSAPCDAPSDMECRIVLKPFTSKS